MSFDPNKIVNPMLDQRLPQQQGQPPQGQQPHQSPPYQGQAPQQTQYPPVYAQPPQHAQPGYDATRAPQQQGYPQGGYPQGGYPQQGAPYPGQQQGTPPGYGYPQQAPAPAPAYPGGGPAKLPDVEQFRSRHGAIDVFSLPADVQNTMPEEELRGHFEKYQQIARRRAGAPPLPKVLRPKGDY